MKSGKLFLATLLLSLFCLAASAWAVPYVQSERSSSSVTDNAVFRSLPDLAADIAVSRVGIKETGYNRGPEVSKIITRNGGQVDRVGACTKSLIVIV